MIRSGYKETQRKVLGCYNGGTLTIWNITAPSGNEYEVSKNSKSGTAVITDKDGFKVLSVEENYRFALMQIYIWEDNHINVLPDLTKASEIKGILDSKGGLLEVNKLVKKGCIESNLQTAAYLFHSHFYDVENTRYNAANLRSILGELTLSEEESIAFCRYAISKDPNCAGGVPNDLIVKITKEGRAVELFTPSANAIDPNWLLEPSFGKSIEMDYDVEMELE